MATPSSILAWGIPWTEEPDRPWSCKELDMTEATEHACTLCYNCLYFLYQGFPGSSAGK